MKPLVLDASCVLPWFREGNESYIAQSHAILDALLEGTLAVSIPSICFLEVLNVAGRKWRLGESELLSVIEELRDLPFDVIDPRLPLVARWISKGLTAYDSSYVAVAEEIGSRVVTADRQILAVAGDRALSLADFRISDWLESD